MARLLRFSPLLLLICASCQQLGPVGDFGQNLADYFTGNTAIRGVARMEDRYFADERRQGINRLSDRDYGRRDPYTERYAQIAQYDSDYLVRATALRALNRSRDQQATPVFIKALGDQSALVRQEAAKALGNIPDPNAAAPLMKLVADPQESRDVRIAAADALRHYPNVQVARTLSGTLGAREFGVAWQSRQSLMSMTGNDLGYSETEWLNYLTGPENPFG